MLGEPVVAVTRRQAYVAVYERDPGRGAWLVHIDGIDGCHTHGRTLRQAGERISEALAAWLDREPGEFVIEHEWPGAVTALAADVAAVRSASDDAAALALKQSRAVAATLDRMGLSRRDTADVLGLSHQRVQQLLEPGPVDGFKQLPRRTGGRVGLERAVSDLKGERATRSRSAPT